MKRIILLAAEALLFLMILGYVHQCHTDRERILIQNLTAATDSLRVSELKNGDLLYQKAAWIVEKEDMEKVLGLKDKELKDLQKKLGSTIQLLAEARAEVRVDTLLCETERVIYKDTTYKFTFKNPFISFDGELNSERVQMNKIRVPVTLRTGLTKDHQIFVESTNPYLVITELNGAIIDKKLIKTKPRLSHGLQLGFGGHYGLVNKNFDVGPYFGYGVEINF